MVDQIESAPDSSMVLIEEIENGLHPIATERMVEYLIDAARRKKIQVLFTTHSEHALRKLPPEGIWACIDGRLYQGKLSIESLRAITGRIERSVAVFVEDQFAKEWVEDALRQFAPDQLGSVEVHAAGGYPHVINVQRFHNDNPTSSMPALAVLDGDAQVVGDLPSLAGRLPGEAPEEEVFGFIYDNRQKLSALMQQRCQVPHVAQDELLANLERTKLDTTDHHRYFERLGQKLGFVSELIVRRGLISIYNEHNRSMIQPIVDLVTNVDHNESRP